MTAEDLAISLSQQVAALMAERDELQAEVAERERLRVEAVNCRAHDLGHYSDLLRKAEAERDALKVEIEGLSLDLAQEQAEHQATQRVLAKVRAVRDEAVAATAVAQTALERVGGLAHAARRYLAGQEDSRGPIAWAAEALDAAAEVVVEPTPSFPCAECGTLTVHRVVPVCPSCGEMYLSPRALVAGEFFGACADAPVGDE
jgi:chromosome segregation ATPase